VLRAPYSDSERRRRESAGHDLERRVAEIEAIGEIEDLPEIPVSRGDV
jgi:hypothetical protein